MHQPSRLGLASSVRPAGMLLDLLGLLGSARSATTPSDHRHRHSSFREGSPLTFWFVRRVVSYHVSMVALLLDVSSGVAALRMASLSVHCGAQLSKPRFHGRASRIRNDPAACSPRMLRQCPRPFFSCFSHNSHRAAYLQHHWQMGGMTTHAKRRTCTITYMLYVCAGAMRWQFMNGRQAQTNA